MRRDRHAFLPDARSGDPRVGRIGKDLLELVSGQIVDRQLHVGGKVVLVADGVGGAIGGVELHRLLLELALEAPALRTAQGDTAFMVSILLPSV